MDETRVGEGDLVAAAARQAAAARLAQQRLAATRPGPAGGSSDVRDAGTPVGFPAGLAPTYEALREIHRGGQGVVFEAVQLATKRRVAVKLLYEGPQRGAANRRRFEREIEVLGQLRHPNVVTIHDSGVIDDRMFYVMDLVSGRPLDRYCADVQRASRAASVSQRDFRDETDAIVRLFIKICAGVNLAHLRGVIHRDLKPGNILVDDSGEPRVLDFGLAKLVADDSAAAGQAMTQTGQFVGSLPWASPEQAAGIQSEVDTRSDVYALGVLLFQALSGQFPYTVVGAVPDVIAAIRHETPMRLNEALQLTLLRSSSGPRRWAMPRIDAELETIVLKCLQKEPARRYQTAGDLERDLQRYLNNEPVEARRDSLLYVLSKHARRHRMAAGFSLALLVVTAAGLVSSLVLWRQAEARRVSAEFEAQSAERARAHADNLAKLEQQARAAAQERLRESEAVTQMLEQLLGSSDPSGFPGEEVTLREALTQHAPPLLENLKGQPRVEARVRMALGMGLKTLGDLSAAEQHLERALQLADGAGPGERMQTDAINLLVVLRREQGRIEEALQLSDRAVAMLPTVSRGDLSASTYLIRGSVHDSIGDAGAEVWFRRALRELDSLEHAPEGDRQQERSPQQAVSLVAGRIEALRGLAFCTFAKGDVSETQRLVQECLALLDASPGHPMAVAETQTALGLLVNSMGRPAEALPLLESALQTLARVSGEDSLLTATGRNNVALPLIKLGRVDEAEQYLLRCCETRRAKLPPNHPDLAACLNNLAGVYETRREYDRAASLFAQAADMLDAGIGPNSANARRARLFEIRSVQRNGDPLADHARAAALAQRLLDVVRASPDAPPPERLIMARELGWSLLYLGRYDEAQCVLSEALEQLAALPPDFSPPTILATRSLLGQALLLSGDAAQALPLLEGVSMELGDVPQVNGHILCGHDAALRQARDALAARANVGR